MAYETLLIEIDQGIATVKINRPKSLNALNAQVLKELVQMVHELNCNPEVKLVILTGEGEKAFVAGADIVAMKEMDALDGKRLCDLGQHAMHLVETSAKPILAAVNGFALGGGMELALSCDFIYASENAKMGLPEVNLGLFPGFGGTQRLARLVGKNLAKELIFTGKVISAQEAFQMGIVNKVCEPGSLMEEVTKVAKEIMKKAPVGVELAKQVINKGTDLDITSGLAMEKAAFPLVFATEDQKEGVTAFLEKRAPKFTGK